MKLLLLITVFSMGILPVSVVAEDCVVLLHGLARTSKSMQEIEKTLLEQGYRVANIDYPSREKNIQTLAGPTITRGLKQCETLEPESIHFVTHSMGGILVRYYLAENNIENLNRVVMLGPPNKGSEVVDKLADMPGFELINGPAGQQLGTDEDSIPTSLPGVDFKLGIIAGTKSINWILSLIIPEEDDGKVAVENTKVEGMSDFIALPATHPLMMKNKEVIEQVVHFLQYGVFENQETPGLREES